MVNVPCSHAAHLERTGHRNYRVGREEHMLVNHKRVAAVWLGDFVKYFYYYNPRTKVWNDVSLDYLCVERCVT